MNRWIIKSDPDEYSAADLERDAATLWDGVSNAAALKNLRGMAAGDEILIYHTGDEKALVASAVVHDAQLDADGKTPHVTIAFRGWLAAPVPLAAIKAEPALAKLALVRIGRLSVMLANTAQWKRLLAMSSKAAPPAKRK